MPHPRLPKTVLLLVIFMLGCSADPVHSMPVPARLIAGLELPVFRDDLALSGLSLAVQRQLAILRKEPDREGLRIGQHSYRTRDILASLERFDRLLTETNSCLSNGAHSHCFDIFNQKIYEQFQIYRLNPSLLTAYYTPTIEVSTQRSEKFRYPIYGVPRTKKERTLSREEIDFEGRLKGKGYELFYAADRFDIYITHIEGGARLVVNDGSKRYTKYLHYAADNEREFTNLYDYMLGQGLLEPDRISRWDQRAALNAHPDLIREAFTSCPGYVFFKVSDVPVITHKGVVLTENRSLATDPDYYPIKGLITFVVVPLPVLPSEETPAESNPSQLEYQTMQRFFIDQDIGHHILGPARADLFFGEGGYAEFLGNNFMANGTIYLLLSK